MVKPKLFKIQAAQAGESTLLIPEFAGLDLLISRRGIGDLLPSEVEILPGGGFTLLSGEFYEDDVFTVTPIASSQPFTSIPVYPASRYPHTLQVQVWEPSTQNANGDWVPGASSTLEYPCRAEPGISVLDGLRQAADGKVLNYGHTLYMPVGAPLLKVGALVTVTDADLNVIASDTIKRFSRGQLNARAWL